jgi:hypothetical protein
MRAAIVESDDFAALATVQQDVFSEQRAAQEFAVLELVIPGANVPAVLKKHG